MNRLWLGGRRIPSAYRRTVKRSGETKQPNAAARRTVPKTVEKTPALRGSANRDGDGRAASSQIYQLGNGSKKLALRDLELGRQDPLRRVSDLKVDEPVVFPQVEANRGEPVVHAVGDRHGEIVEL